MAKIRPCLWQHLVNVTNNAVFDRVEPKFHNLFSNFFTINICTKEVNFRRKAACEYHKKHCRIAVRFFELWNCCFVSQCLDDPNKVASWKPNAVEDVVVLEERSETKPFRTRTRQMISFFPVRDIPLRFISLNRIFSPPNGRVYPIFV